MAGEYCTWTPALTVGRRVSKMFHDTTCGQRNAPIFNRDDWVFCPYCSLNLRFVDSLQPHLDRVPDAR